MMKKHFNIAIFIPHLGCKNDCVFCNQKIITGSDKRVSCDDVRIIIEEYIESRKNTDIIGESEIAFFGGSFTGLDRDEMTEFLKIANEYTDGKNITGIRLSTRPDYITDEILDILEKYNVNAIELGVQSMFDDVLLASRRGHTADDTIKACSLIGKRKFSLTGQMMLGLPHSNSEKDIDTAYKLVELGIDSARIYPTIVFVNTELYRMYEAERYNVINLDEAVYRAKEIKKIFDKNRVKILRIGLCSSDNMGNSSLFIGPYHPSFGELVESEIIFDQLCAEIEDYIKRNRQERINSLNITAEKRAVSKISGHKRKNITRLEERFGVRNIKITEYNTRHSENSNEIRNEGEPTWGFSIS